MSISTLLDHASINDAQSWKDLSVAALKITSPSNQLVLQPNGQGSNSITLTAANPSANRVYTIPDEGANASFVLSTGGSSPVVNSGAFAYAPTVTVAGVAGSWLTYRSVYQQVGGIYVVGIGGTISAPLTAATTGNIVLSSLLSALPGGAGIAGGTNVAPGGGLSLGFAVSTQSTAGNESILINGANQVISASFAASAGFAAGNAIYVNATIIYSVP